MNKPGILPLTPDQVIEREEIRIHTLAGSQPNIRIIVSEKKVFKDCLTYKKIQNIGSLTREDSETKVVAFYCDSLESIDVDGIDLLVTVKNQLAELGKVFCLVNHSMYLQEQLRKYRVLKNFAIINTARSLPNYYPFKEG